MRTNKTYRELCYAKGGPFEAMKLVIREMRMDNWHGKEDKEKEHYKKPKWECFELSKHSYEGPSF